MDGKGFRKLRITMAAAVAGGGVLPALAHDAGAISVIPTHATPFNHTSNFQTRYALQKGVVGGPFGATAGFGLAKGSFGHSTVTVTYAHCTQFQSPTACASYHNKFTATQARAFDAGFVFSAGGQVFTNPSGIVVGNDPDLISSALLPSGLSVVWRFHRFGQGNYRIFFTVENPGSTTVKVPVVVGTNLGSNTTTEVEASADGNRNAGRGDTWFVTDDGQVSGSPITLIARGNRNRHKTTWLVKMLQAPGGRSHSDLWVEQRTVKIKPGQTVAFLYFAHLYKNGDPQSAETAAYKNGDSLETAGYLAGLTPDQRSQVVNWKSLPSGP